MNITPETAITPTPGFYPNMSRAQYDSIDAWNYSTIKHGLKSMRHLKWEREHRKPATPEMILGNAVHLAVLEPQRFGPEVAILSKIKRQSNAGKAEYDAFIEANKDRLIVAEDRIDDIKGMVNAINAEPDMRLALSLPATSEATCVWFDPDTDLLCKTRIDRLTTEGWIIELKTTGKIKVEDFSREIPNRNYDLQAAMQVEGLRRTRGDLATFSWFCVESEGPFDTAIYEIHNETLADGRGQFVRLMRQVKQCLQTGNWPGVCPTPIQINKPQWSFKHAELELPNVG